MDNVTIDAGPVGLWLAIAARGLTPGDPILRGSFDRFRSWLQNALELFGFQGNGYTLYSLRRGGATHFFWCGGDVCALWYEENGRTPGR